MSFLGVEMSLTGRRWIGPTPEADRMAEAMAQQTGLMRPLCQSLARLGVDADGAQAYLAPTLRDLLPDPSVLKDMDKAAERFVHAVSTREKIAIFADYDVDGATSASLLIDWLRQMGLTATLYIPDRIDEGYGPNVAAMEGLAKGHDLILCVDCGTLSHEALDAVQGCDVIVLDHHLGSETLPKAVAIVNPNRQDEDGTLGHFCAAGVVFLLLVAVNRVMKAQGKAGPNLMAMLDLVALGTVADVAPLIGVNRAFVQQGLKVMAGRARVGLRVLADVARMDQAPTPYHLGFLLGPRINAGGRIGAADLGARLLSCETEHEAQALAERLDALNTERREIEAAVRIKALEQAEARGFDAPLAWAAGEGWHPGIVGIVAARLKEAANRPAVVIGFDGDVGKGSARSVKGVDLGAQIQRLAHEGLIEKGGGHKMAAGLSLSRDQLEPAMTRLSELMAKQGADLIGPSDIRVDGLLMPSAATQDLVEKLDTAGPFGAAAPGPRFVFADQKIQFARRVGETHLKIQFGDETRLDGICFGAFDGPLGSALSEHKGARFHLAGRLDLNTFRGTTSVQLRLEDAAPV